MTTVSYVNLYDLGGLISQVGSIISATPFGFFGSSESMDYFHFLLDNSKIFLSAFSAAVFQEESDLKNTTMAIFWVEFALTFASSCALVLIGLFLFKPMFSKIQKERNKALELFLIIPKEVVSQLSQGKDLDDIDFQTTGMKFQEIC